MTKSIKLAVAAAIALSATSAFATNGTTLSGIGIKTRGMGGAGIGVSHGAESTLANPVFIKDIAKDLELSFGGTIFMPQPITENTVPPNDASKEESEANFYAIPTISSSFKINDNFYAGLGLWGAAGLGVDYRDSGSANHFDMVTGLLILQIGIPLVYTNGAFSFGVTPLVQYGTLDIDYNLGGMLTSNPALAPALALFPAGMDGYVGHVGEGIGSDLKLGYNIGMALDMGGLTLGAVYKAQINMDYDGQLTTAVNGMGALAGVQYENDKLSNPAEYGVGISYSTKGGHTLALDYKRILWEDADGYRDFGWEDQDVISVGYEYMGESFGFRLGYSDANSPVVDNTGKGLYLDSGSMPLTNTFNALGFPATITTHYSAGITYNVNDRLGIDVAAVYGTGDDFTVNNFMGAPITTAHDQESVSFQLNFAY